MAMSFEESLQKICKELIPSAEDRQSFNEDAKVIRNELMQRMKDRCKNFKSIYNGLSLTGSYLDRLKIDLPDEFDMHMKLVFPFRIRPVADQQRPGFVKLVGPPDCDHYVISGPRRHCIKRHLLQKMIRKAFEKVIDEDIILDVNGRRYKVRYPTYARGQGVAHTIIAEECVKDGREISFDFVPAIEFKPSEWPFKKLQLDTQDISWFAVPFGKKLHRIGKSNKFAFMVCAPHWERKVLRDKNNLKNSLRLMKALRNRNLLGRLSSYMLKSIYLEEVEKRPDTFWDQPMGVILITMLRKLADALEEDSLPFFLHNGFNHFDLVPQDLIDEYKTKVNAILTKLCNFQKETYVNYNQIANIFIKI